MRATSQPQARFRLTSVSCDHGEFSCIINEGYQTYISGAQRVEAWHISAKSGVKTMEAA